MLRDVRVHFDYMDTQPSSCGGSGDPTYIYDWPSGNYLAGPYQGWHRSEGLPGGAAYSGDRWSEWVNPFPVATPAGGYPQIFEARRNPRRFKPDGCPTGTKPINESDLPHDVIEGVEGAMDASPDDWTGVSPDGHIWGHGEEPGTAEDWGHWSDIVPGKGE